MLARIGGTGRAPSPHILPCLSCLYRSLKEVMIPGLYHCPCGQPVDGDLATNIQFMPLLTTWVENGKAPATVEIPVTAQTTGLPLSTLTVTPFNPLTPAPKNNGLNSNYDYIGKISAYQPGNELRCTQQGQTLVCSHQRP
jgi:hypothetical protein